MDAFQLGARRAVRSAALLPYIDAQWTLER